MSEATCPHRQPCPGCPRLGQRGIAPEAMDALTLVAARAGLPEPVVHEGSPWSFRRRAKLAVRGRSTSPKLGIFQADSHRIVDMPRCPIHHPLINRVAQEVRAGIRETGLAPYADRPHRGLLRYVQIAVDDSGTRAQLAVVTNDRSPESMDPLATQLRDRLGDALQGLWWNGNPERTNSIFGPHWAHLAGDKRLELEVGGVRIHVPPGAFAQNHGQLFERLVERVRSLVPNQVRVREFYAGTGPIGLGLADRCRAVEFNEVDPHALVGLATGLAQLPPEARSRCRVLPGRAGECLDDLESVDIAIVDPPRKGLDPELIEALCAGAVPQLVYVSCGWRSFETESALLSEAGLLLRSLEAYAMFPYTEHVEIVAHFARAAT